jgi:hypothetical protein
MPNKQDLIAKVLRSADPETVRIESSEWLEASDDVV